MDEPQVDQKINALEQAWQKVDQDWENLEAHQQFLELAMTLGQLGKAGALYRKEKQNNPVRITMAESQIQKILVFAMTHLALSQDKTTHASSNIRTMLRISAMIFLLCSIGLLSWVVLRH